MSTVAPDSHEVQHPSLCRPDRSNCSYAIGAGAMIADHEAAVRALISERDALVAALDKARDEVDEARANAESWREWGEDWKRKAQGPAILLEASTVSQAMYNLLLSWRVPMERNRRRRHVPAVPKPLVVWAGVGCPKCDARFYTVRGYRGHYALAHLLELEDE